MFKKCICLLICLCFVLIPSSCANRMQEFSGSFIDTFDTVITISGYARNATEFNEFAAICHDEFLYYHRLFDVYNDYEGIANIKTINDNAGVAPVKVEKPILELLSFAKNMYNECGRVNVLLGSVTALWNNCRTAAMEDSAQARLPSNGSLAGALGFTSMELLQINDKEGTVYLSEAGARLDVGAVAKGFACEAVAKKLSEKGFENFVLSAGGNVYAKGLSSPGSDKGWEIGIQNPDTSSSAAYVDVVNVSDMAVVSAGNGARSYSVNGKEYGHIIDPQTLYPCENYLSVSVVASSSTLADYLATELFLSTVEEGMALCEKYGVEAIWINNNGQVEYTQGYLKYSSKF